MDFSQVDSVTLPEGEATKIQINGITVWEKSSDNWGVLHYDLNERYTYIIETEEDFNKLAGENYDVPTITFSDGTVIYKNEVFGFDFGNNFPIYIPDYFLCYYENFDSPITIPEGVTRIGAGFLTGAVAMNHTVSLPVSLLRIYAAFLAECVSFNQDIRIPYNVGYIGSDFMYNCKSFVSELQVDAVAHPSDTGSLSTDDPTAAIYTTGVTISGFSSPWKIALPNRTTTPYRKIR